MQIKLITNAIKNFDIDSLNELLDDDKAHQEILKTVFIKE